MYTAARSCDSLTTSPFISTIFLSRWSSSWAIRGLQKDTLCLGHSFSTTFLYPTYFFTTFFCSAKLPTDNDVSSATTIFTLASACRLIAQSQLILIGKLIPVSLLCGNSVRSELTDCRLSHSFMFLLPQPSDCIEYIIIVPLTNI